MWAKRQLELASARRDLGLLEINREALPLWGRGDKQGAPAGHMGLGSARMLRTQRKTTLLPPLGQLTGLGKTSSWKQNWHHEHGHQQQWVVVQQAKAASPALPSPWCKHPLINALLHSISSQHDAQSGFNKR